MEDGGITLDAYLSILEKKLKDGEIENDDIKLYIEEILFQICYISHKINKITGYTYTDMKLQNICVSEINKEKYY